MKASARCIVAEYRFLASLGKNAFCLALGAADDCVRRYPSSAMRITGGRFRSRALQAPKGLATRPTTDRVREALFGILVSAGVVEAARVLDLYAGTGALALEALSRGAVQAMLVESSRDAIAALRANVAALGLEACAQVVAGDVGHVTGRITRAGPFDLVLADPPWSLVDEGGAGAALSDLVLSGAISSDAWVVLEHSSRTDPPHLDSLVRQDIRRYGDTALTFYKPAILAPLRP
jgi:16S rRNA (guanine966-N2)-methyltransferase